MFELLLWRGRFLRWRRGLRLRLGCLHIGEHGVRAGLARGVNGKRDGRDHEQDRGPSCGFGQGSGCATRAAGSIVTLVEIEPQLAALAAENAQRNGLAARVRAVALDVAAPPRAFAAAGLAAESVMRVMMNPPFNDPARQRSSPDAKRRLAHVASRDVLARWVKTAVRLLRPRGTLTLIWRADGLAEVLRLLEGAFGAITVLPVHPKVGAPAIRIIVRATKASRAPLVLLPGLALSDGAGHPTVEAEAILRAGAGLPLGKV